MLLRIDVSFCQTEKKKICLVLQMRSLEKQQLLIFLRVCFRELHPLKTKISPGDVHVFFERVPLPTGAYMPAFESNYQRHFKRKSRTCCGNGGRLFLIPLYFLGNVAQTDLTQNEIHPCAESQHKANRFCLSLRAQMRIKR